MRSMGATQEEYYRGVRMVPYDLVKEIVLAIVGVGVLALLISVVLSSPDVPQVTIATWAQQNPPQTSSLAPQPALHTDLPTTRWEPARAGVRSRLRSGLESASRSIRPTPL